MKIEIGDRVRLINTKNIGTVVEVSNNFATVTCNNKKLKLNINKLEKISEEEFIDENKPKVTYKYTSSKPYTLQTCSKPSSELMIRHQDSITAMQNVEKFLDTAYVNRITEVRIIHGKRGGVLRKSLHELLDSHPYVLSYTLGDYYSGQYGVTIVKLKILN